jgi:hypothetical protein
VDDDRECQMLHCTAPGRWRVVTRLLRERGRDAGNLLSWRTEVWLCDTHHDDLKGQRLGTSMGYRVMQEKQEGT